MYWLNGSSTADVVMADSWSADNLSEFISSCVHLSTNNTSLSADRKCPDHDRAGSSFRHDPENIVGKIGMVFITVMITAGTVGNLMVLLAVVKCHKLRKSYNFIIAALAVTDLIFNTTIMPFYADSFLHRKWRFSDELCRLNTFLGTMVVMASALHIGCIALNRYFLIVMPHLYRYIAQRRAIACQIAFIWILSFLVVLPGVLGWHALVEYSDQIGRCNYVRSESKTCLYFIFSIGFLLPCGIMTFAYVQIYLTIHRSMKSMTQYEDAVRMSPGQTPDSTKRKAYFRVPLILVHSNSTPTAPHRNKGKIPKERSSTSGSGGKEVSNGKMFRNSDCANRTTPRNKKPEIRGNKKDSLQINHDDELIPQHSEHLEEQNSRKNLGIDSSTQELCTKNSVQRNTKPNQMNGEMPAEPAETKSTSIEVPSPKVPHASPGLNIDVELARQGSCDTPASQSPSPSPSHVGHLDSTTRRLHKRDVRIIHMILALFLAFTLTYLPFAILNFVDQEGVFEREWYMLTSLAFWAGACVNPWIYGIMNKQFRDAYRAILCKCHHQNSPVYHH